MKVTHHNLLRAAGLAAVLAGTCYVLMGLFHPANVASAVTSTRWEIVHLLACAMCFFGLLGITGLYAKQSKKVGWLGLVGYILLSVWFVLIMGFSFVEVFILPQVATSSPTLVEAWMGMFTGAAGDFDLGVLPTVWKLTAPAYMLGGLLFGLAVFRAAILPRWAGALLALGTLLAPVAGLLPNASQPKVAIPVGLALAWLGYGLWAERRAASLAPAPREPVGTPEAIAAPGV